MSATIQDCDCALRSFWDGPCEYHLHEELNDPGLEKKFTDYGAACTVEINKCLDPIIEQAAKELGWQAGKELGWQAGMSKKNITNVETLSPNKVRVSFECGDGSIRTYEYSNSSARAYLRGSEPSQLSGKLVEHKKPK